MLRFAPDTSSEPADIDGELPKVQQARLTLLFGIMDSPDDASWIVAKTRETLQSYPNSTPVVIWQEHAGPLSLPYDTRGLAEEEDICTEDLNHALLADRLDNGFVGQLRRMYEAHQENDIAYSHQCPPTHTDVDPSHWQISVYKDIQKLRQEGWHISLVVEHPPFEGWLYSLKGSAAKLEGVNALCCGNIDAGLEMLDKHYEYIARGWEHRSKVLGFQIAERVRRQTEDVQILHRSWVHAQSTSSVLKKLGVDFDNAYEELSERQYKFGCSRHAPPFWHLSWSGHALSDKNALLRRQWVHILFQNTYSPLRSYVTAEQIGRAVAKIAQATIDKWFEKIGELDDRIEPGELMLDCIEWLELNSVGKAQQALINLMDAFGGHVVRD